MLQIYLGKCEVTENSKKASINCMWVYHGVSLIEGSSRGEKKI